MLFGREKSRTTADGQYTGEWSHGTMNGHGLMVYTNGDAFEGEWVEGKRQGHGILMKKNGSQYEGDWKNDVLSGTGTFVSADGDEFRGSFENGAFCGEGVYTFANGDRYEGSFVNGVAEGRGKLFSHSGDEYDCLWKDGKKHGRGVYRGKSGSVFEGEFADDELKNGTLELKSGSKFSGSFCNGHMSQGTLLFSSGAVYTGDFDDDGLPSGFGEMKEADGSVYTGQWLKGKKHGKGKLDKGQGIVIEGRWTNDVLSGQVKLQFKDTFTYEGIWSETGNFDGVIRFDNGCVYTGKSRNFKFEGQGKLVTENGSVTEGEWHEGMPNGFCNVTCKDGSHYEGYMKNGEMEGNGSFTAANGVKRVGIFVKNQLHGYGSIILPSGASLDCRFEYGDIVGKVEVHFPDGSRYVGDWKDDGPDGKGTMYNADGTELTGIWKNGEFVQEITSSKSSSVKVPDKKTAVPGASEQKPKQKENGISSPKPAVVGNESLAQLLNELDSFVGLDTVKKQVNSLINQITLNKKREQMGVKQTPISLHMIFTGNPGTGKTTIARLLAKIFKAMGLLSEGQLVETDRSGLVADYIGQTATKTKKVVESALGGVLFIDEAYALVRSDSSSDYGKEAIDTLLKEMEDHRHELVVIAAGYPKEMTKFINANPGLQSRFNRFIHFEDYKPDELYQIFCKFCAEKHYTLTDDAAERVKNHLAYMYDTRTENFANARDVRNFFDKVDAQQDDRLIAEQSNDLFTICGRDIDGLDPESTAGDSEESLDSLMEKLDRMVGLKKVKDELHTLINVAQMNALKSKRGLQTQNVSLHMVFTGNPGTGKTTVARLLAAVFRNLGYLSQGQLVEVSRADLVAGYVGQTAMKVQERVKEALGGILFIDEAYSLKTSANDSFGQEAIDTLVKCMEDYRKNLVVIIAGYPGDIEQFLMENAGLKSRINTFIHFEDYSAEELYRIFISMCEGRNESYVLSDECRELARRYWQIRASRKERGFGNGREVRNVFEQVIKKQNNRLVESINPLELTEEEIMRIDVEDLQIDDVARSIDLSRPFIEPNPVVEPEEEYDEPDEDSVGLSAEDEAEEEDEYTKGLREIAAGIKYSDDFYTFSAFLSDPQIEEIWDTKKLLAFAKRASEIVRNVKYNLDQYRHDQIVQMAVDTYCSLLKEFDYPKADMEQAVYNMLVEFYMGRIRVCEDTAEYEAYDGKIPEVKDDDIDTVDFAMLLAQVPWQPEKKEWLDRLGINYDYNQYLSVTWFASQITLGSGHYSRRVPNHSAKTTYNRLLNPYALLWVASVLGEDDELIELILQSVKLEKTAPEQSKLVRDNIPFSRIAEMANAFMDEPTENNEDG